MSYDDDALALLPDIAARPPAGDYFLALVRPIGAIIDRYALLLGGLIDISIASGGTLDAAGLLVYEARGALTDDEYRRIIAGRRVALAGGDLLAGWQALTDAVDVELDVTGPAVVDLLGRVAYVPGDIFVQRAASVLRALRPGGVAISATLYRADSAIYDDAAMGYDVGDYAWSIG